MAYLSVGSFTSILLIFLTFQSLQEKYKFKVTYFADLACGNGVLSYLLTRQGFQGFGIDARSRGIWESFKAEGTDLRKAAMDPTDKDYTLPPNVDFVIGNHSDELTPWIPIMAAR